MARACFVDGLVRVAREEGVEGLWSSLVASLMLVSNPSIQFMIYESLKRIFQRRYKTVSDLSC